MTRDVIPYILPPRPAGPDRHPASAGLAGLATSPNYSNCVCARLTNRTLGEGAFLLDSRDGTF